jgi:hypothetical protein
MFYPKECDEGGYCGLDVEVTGTFLKWQCPNASKCPAHDRACKVEEVEQALFDRTDVLKPSRSRLAAKGVHPAQRGATPVEKGPVSLPVLVRNWDEFVRVFGNGKESAIDFNRSFGWTYNEQGLTYSGYNTPVELKTFFTNTLSCPLTIFE